MSRIKDYYLETIENNFENMLTTLDDLAYNADTADTYEEDLRGWREYCKQVDNKVD